MRVGNCRLFIWFFLTICTFPVFDTYADGSKDLYRPGTRGKRAYLFSRVSSVGADDLSWPFRTYGEHFVYVNVGETITMASSAQGFGDVRGVIRLTNPNGQTISFEYNSSTGAGRIPNRTAELAGPRSPGQGAGGDRYLPHYHTANIAGVWKVEFLPVYELTPGQSLSNYASNENVSDANWWQAQTTAYRNWGHDIAAWDVSVWNNNEGWKAGRVYATVMNLSIFNEFGAGGGFFGKMYPLTKDGWVYEVDNNGQNGLFFTFFVNNKGFYRSATDHMPSYQSLNFSDTRLLPLVKDPRSFDTGSDITCKMFYTYPDRAMPAEANIYADGQTRTTWLINNPTPPEIHNLTLTGVEGTDGHASQKGGFIRFEASVAGIVKINFNLEGFAPRTITDIAVQGDNAIFWDGKDGAGNYLPEGSIPADVSVQLFGAEVHFPYIDKEINPNGIRIQRLDDTSPNSDVVYWDDSGISGGNTNTSPNPIINLNGRHSASSGNPGGERGNGGPNGHIWGRNTSGTTGSGNSGDGNYSFGNEKSMDTWSYIPSNTVTETVNLEILSVDLGVANFSNTLGVATVRPGDSWTYSVDVFNTVGSSNARGAVLELHLPVGIDVATLNAVTVNVIAGTGSEIPDSRSFDHNTGRFRTLINLAAGARLRFTIPVTVSVRAVPGTNAGAWATVLRPADVYDYDATNMAPDGSGNAILPTDPFFECQGPNPDPNTSTPYNRESGDLIPCNNLAFNSGPGILATPLITLTKAVTNTQPIAKINDMISYRFDVSNTGNVNLTNVDLTDALPDISAITGPTYVTGNGDVTLSPGEVWQYTAMYTVKALDVAVGSVTNSATVSATPATGGGAVSATASVNTVIYSADLRVIKTVSHSNPPVGSIVDFEISVTNDGPADATNVTIMDVIPNGYADISEISTDGIHNGNELTWNFSITDGQTLTFSYRARVLAPGEGISHRNIAVISDSDVYDPDSSNNSAQVTVTPKQFLFITNPVIRTRMKNE